MKKLIALLGLWTLASVFTVLLISATPSPQSAHERIDPLDGIVYFKNPVTGKLALYISFELVPDRLYSVQVTDDGVTWSEPWTKSTKGALHDEYYSFNVDPCGGLWPRVIDLGVAP